MKSYASGFPRLVCLGQKGRSHEHNVEGERKDFMFQRIMTS